MRDSPKGSGDRVALWRRWVESDVGDRAEPMVVGVDSRLGLWVMAERDGDRLWPESTAEALRKEGRKEEREGGG